jgi:O-antigen/teichoic acid export membrane protein
MALQDVNRANQILSKIHQWISVIRLVPFDTNTPEGRSKERLRRVALTALVSALAQAVSVLTMLISIPLTLNYLGAERYGLWVSISSLITLLGFADLGMGNGLLNAIAEANGRNDPRAAKSYVSSAFYMLLGVALLFGIMWVMLYDRIPWHWLFNVITPQAIAETGPALAIFVWCMLINLPMSLVQKIHEGYQEGYINGLWRVAGSLLGLVSVLFMISLQAGLPLLVLAMAASPILVLFLNALFLFFRERPSLLPRVQLFNKTAFLRIFKNGSLFFVLQLAVAVGFQSDNLVIAHYLGANQVPQYAVPMKLFMLIPSMLNFVIAPLWPAYGEAIARRDLTWVRRIFKRSLFLSFGVSLLPSLFLVVFGGRIIEFWVGSEVEADFLLLAGFGLWVILLSLSGPIAMFLNGANVINFQIVCAILMAVMNLVSSIFLVQRIGVSGPVYGSVIAWSAFSLLPAIIYIPRLFNSWSVKPPSKK